VPARGQFLLGQVAQQSVRVADQRADQIGAGLGILLGDRRLAGLVVVAPVACTTSRAASKTRFGRAEAASRRRQ
jgi:hypothetical protein